MSGTFDYEIGSVVGPQGPAATIAVGDTTTLQPGNNATVTNSGTSGAAVFNFGIPHGATGATGNGIASISKTGSAGLVDTYRILYTSGEHFDFTVTNGANGEITGSSIADPFSPSANYVAGDPVIYSGQLYFFDAAHTAGAWTGTDATAVQLAETVRDLKSALESEEEKINAAFITDSASGTIASFSDGAGGLPVKDLTVGIEPVQNLNGYSEPWPADGGKNKANITAETIQKPSWYTGGWNGTSVNSKHGITQTKGYQQGGAGGFHLTNIPAGTYTFSMTFSGTTPSCILYVSSVDGGGNITTIVGQLGMTKDGTRYKYTFTVPDGAEDVIFRPTIWSATESYDLEDIQIESGSSATEWSPYANICPITGWTGANVYRTGKNLLNCQIEGKEQNGIISSNNSNGSIHLQGTTTGARFYTYLKNNFKLNQGTYRLSKNLSLTSGSISVQLQGFNSANQIISRHTVGNSYTDVSVSITEPAAYYIVFIDITGMTTGTAVNLDLEIQLELGSTASAWEPFYGATIPISWQTEAGTVYGGELNVTTGKLTVDKVLEEFSSNTGFVKTSVSYPHLFQKALANETKATKGNEKSRDSRSNVAEVWETTGGATYASQHLVTLTKLTSSPYTSIIFLNIDSITELSELNTYLSNAPVQLLYPLATPVEYTLTAAELATLLGTNNIWADTGDTSVEYCADTKLYVDRKVSAAQKLMELIVTANREDSMKASAPYTSGDLIIVNGTLYKATASIASGATLTPGTNVSATTVAAEIAALA